MRYAFSGFTLDADTRVLSRSGRVVPLSPKAFDFLELLLRERPRAVSVTRIRAAIWPDTHVGAASLHVDPAAPCFVRTVPRFGYAFCGEATGGEGGRTHALADLPRADAWWLSTTDGDLRLHAGDNVLGRDASLPARFDRPGISRRHACIRIEGGRAVLTDLGSKNGTFVNGRPVDGATTLQDEDEIRLGRHATVVIRRSNDPETETETP
jgi:hypothetical protein